MRPCSPFPTGAAVWFRATLVAGALAGGAVGLAGDDPAPANAAVLLRVETELSEGSAPEPVARSLTLFQDGVAWNFLEPSTAADEAVPGSEIVLHDPARGRVVVIDPARRVRTEIPATRLARVLASLRTWAEGSDDPLVRWSASATCPAADPSADDAIVVEGPGVRYAVAALPAPTPGAAEQYRSFADVALGLRALTHPGGVPPFARIAINRQLAAANLLPETVTLELDGPGLGQSRVLRSRHRFAPRLDATDQRRIESASALLAVAEVVDAETYAGRNATAER